MPQLSGRACKLALEIIQHSDQGTITLGYLEHALSAFEDELKNDTDPGIRQLR